MEARSVIERPILFSAPMVRAILDGRKTVTRRPVKPQPKLYRDFLGDGYVFAVEDKDRPWVVRCLGSLNFAELYSPYGKPGDRLWVRETFKPIASGEVKHGYGEVRHGYAYRADGTTRWNDRTTKIHDLSGQPPTGPMQFQQRPWKPSIHMPHRASRITLEVTSVRVERLRDITEEQARAEGVQPAKPLDPHSGKPRDDVQFERPHVVGFASLWDELNGAGSWVANPWVWVVEFRRIDQEARAA